MSRALRVLVVDDVELARRRLVRALEEHADVSVVGEAADGEQMQAQVAALRPDLVFLDIAMPEQDGFAALAGIAPAERPLVVFLTAYSEHALQAFRVDAVDYLLKPVDGAALAIALDKVRARLALPGVGAVARGVSGKTPDRLSLRTDDGLVWVALAQIGWIEAIRNHVAVHTDEGDHIVRSTLRDMLDRLAAGHFVQASRSAVVNAAQVKKLLVAPNGEHRLRLQGGVEVVIGKSFREGVLRALD